MLPSYQIIMYWPITPEEVLVYFRYLLQVPILCAEIIGVETIWIHLCFNFFVLPWMLNSHWWSAIERSPHSRVESREPMKSVTLELFGHRVGRDGPIIGKRLIIFENRIQSIILSQFALVNLFKIFLRFSICYVFCNQIRHYFLCDIFLNKVLR